MDPLGPRHYRLLAEVLIDSAATMPDASLRGLEAGRAWGRQHVAALTAEAKADTPVGAVESEDRLMLLLDELGFAPDRTVGDVRRQIGLRHCPFLELSSSSSEIVCPIHLGLMQGAMESWRAPVTVDRLEPFAEANLCLAHLGPAGAS
jgi:predicted ArsR family transcriptional regulator